jgi:hypothetical protein
MRIPAVRTLKADRDLADLTRSARRSQLAGSLDLLDGHLGLVDDFGFVEHGNRRLLSGLGSWLGPAAESGGETQVRHQVSPPPSLQRREAIAERKSAVLRGYSVCVFGWTAVLGV